MYDLEQFYAEQLIIISRDNIEPISFHDKLTEILDRLGMFFVDSLHLDGIQFDFSGNNKDSSSNTEKWYSIVTNQENS